MAIIDEIKGLAIIIGADIKENKGIYTFQVLVVERKAFLSIILKDCQVIALIGGSIKLGFSYGYYLG